MIKNKFNNQPEKTVYSNFTGLDEKNTFISQHRFINQLHHEPNYPPKKRELKNWYWQAHFKSLEDATEFLLNYSTELGPLAEECLKRLNKNSELIKQLTQQNKSLKHQLKGVYSNDKKYKKKHDEKRAF
jgi:hypothetical protein